VHAAVEPALTIDYAAVPALPAQHRPGTAAPRPCSAVPQSSSQTGPAAEEKIDAPDAQKTQEDVPDYEKTPRTTEDYKELPGIQVLHSKTRVVSMMMRQVKMGARTIQMMTPWVETRLIVQAFS